MKNKMKKIHLLLIAVALFVIACTTNAITGRSQLSLVSESSLQQEAVTQYRSFLSQNKVISSNSNKDAEMVKRVGTRIANASPNITKTKDYPMNWPDTNGSLTWWIIKK